MLLTYAWAVISLFNLKICSNVSMILLLGGEIVVEWWAKLVNGLPHIHTSYSLACIFYTSISASLRPYWRPNIFWNCIFCCQMLWCWPSYVKSTYYWSDSMKVTNFRCISSGWIIAVICSIVLQSERSEWSYVNRAALWCSIRIWNWTFGSPRVP